MNARGEDTGTSGADEGARIGIRALKQNASAVVARVKLGAPTVVTDRGVPVARIVPMQSTPLQDLISSGALLPARFSMSEFFARRAGWDQRVPEGLTAAETPSLTAGEILDELREERL